MTKLEMKLPALTPEFDLCIQTHDGHNYVVRFEDGNCVGCWNTTMPEDEKANLEIMQAKALIDRNVDLGWLTSYGPALKTGKFEYTVWDGRHEAKRELEMEVAA